MQLPDPNVRFVEPPVDVFLGEIDYKKFQESISDIVTLINLSTETLWQNAYPTTDNDNLKRVFRMAFFLELQSQWVKGVKKSE